MSKTPVVHLGCDTGEAPPGPAREAERALIEHVTAVNIACGGHAGDASSMREFIELAQEKSCLIGAHPSYPDREGFGRRVVQIDRYELGESLSEQLREFESAARASGATVSHIKAHGALYHAIANDAEFAQWYWTLCSGIFPTTRFVGPIGARSTEALRDARIPLMIEGFCDRVYEPDWTLRARDKGDALISDVRAAADQAEKLIETHGCDLLCVHADSPGSDSVARAVSDRLRLLGLHPGSKQ